MVVTSSDTLAVTVTVIFPSAPAVGVVSVPEKLVALPVRAAQLLMSAARAAVEVFSMVTVVVVTTVWSVTRVSPVPQLLLPPVVLHVVVMTVGPLSVSNTGVIVAETAILGVLRTTGVVTATAVTETEGNVVGPAANAAVKATATSSASKVRLFFIPILFFLFDFNCYRWLAISY